MTGSRPRAAPFLCPPLPLSFPGAPLQPPPLHRPFSRRAPFPKHHPRLPLQPRLSTAPSSRRVPSPKRHPHPPLQSPPLRHPFLPAGSHPHGASRTGLTRPPPRWHPFPRRGPNPVAPPAPASPSPASPPSRPPGEALTPRYFPHPPLPAPPLHYPFLPAGPLPKVPPAPAPPDPSSPPPLPSAGITPLNFFCIVSLSFHSARCQKQTWRAAFRHLLAAPGRFWALSGLFRVLFGLFRVFFEKSWAKNFPFSPASGIMKPLTGTARR